MLTEFFTKNPHAQWTVEAENKNKPAGIAAVEALKKCVRKSLEKPNN
jgi:hypothetical protein